MEINEAISLVSSVAGGMKELKQACSLIPVGIFQPTKKKLLELQEKITDLEGRISNGFPKLKQLIILYSDLKTNVGIARALSDKIAEIVILSPTVAPNYVVALIGPTQDDHNRITNKVNELPYLDQAEAGALIEKLNRISTHIRDIQIILDKGGFQEIELKVNEIAKVFRDIAREYVGIESKLSELLNKKILKDFETFK